ncbi:hypothetical protein [Aquimarina sp. AD10]|nr:hypothetical protein [Aquimarina sp. AD10]
MKNRIIIILSIGIITISKSFGQNSPKQLGIDFFNALKSNDSTKIMKIIPEPETLIEFSKSIGIKRNKKEITEFFTKYPNEVKQFINRFENLKDYGIKLGIELEFAEFKDIEINTREQQISEEGKTIPVTDLNVIFNYKTKSYRLILNSIFEYNKVWFLAGDKPRLEKY